MKKKLICIMLALCFLIPGVVMLSGCGKETVQVPAGEIVADSSIYDWSQYSSGKYTCAATQVDFDKINIEEITAMRVTMYVGSDQKGVATCTGDQIPFYFKMCAPYWKDSNENALTADTYENVAGKQWVECYFAVTESPRVEEDWSMEYTGSEDVKPTSYKIEITTENSKNIIVYSYTHTTPTT